MRAGESVGEQEDEGGRKKRRYLVVFLAAFFLGRRQKMFFWCPICLAMRSLIRLNIIALDTY
jgi:hypothetical protein